MSSLMSDQLVNIKLVAEVEKHQCLYDFRQPEYSRRDKTESAWNDVGKVVNLSGQDCKERWRNIRSVFARHMKQQASSNMKPKKPYYLHEALQFTIPFIKSTTATTTANLQEITKTEQLYLPYLNEEEEEDPLPTEFHQPPSPMQAGSMSGHEQPTQQLESEFTPKKLHKSKRRKYIVDDVFVEYYLNTMKARLPTTTNTTDMYEKKQFLESLLPEIEELTREQMKTFRRRVLSLIDDIVHTTPSILTPNDDVQPNLYPSE